MLHENSGSRKNVLGRPAGATDLEPPKGGSFSYGGPTDGPPRQNLCDTPNSTPEEVWPPSMPAGGLKLTDPRAAPLFVMRAAVVYSAVRLDKL